MRAVDTRNAKKSWIPFIRAFRRQWVRFWMRHAGLTKTGRIATQLATWYAPPHKTRVSLARMNKAGYISPSATIYHSNLHLGDHIFIDDCVLIYEQRQGGGAVKIHDGVFIYRDVILESGYGGSLSIGPDSRIHPRCQLNAYIGSIHIGADVMLAPACALYPYAHGIVGREIIRKQPLESKGDIIVEDGAWLGYGVIVVANVRIGEGAVVAAGSIVTKDIPPYAIAVGSPATIQGYRTDQPSTTQVLNEQIIAE
ncbi:acyltransferase [Chloroflexi bacterium TSY]|nr:acyltransferase [Chloroflexi bacterium TSY]